MREEEADAEGTWAVSYGDMVTLLLTFFILFFNINPNAKESKGEQDRAHPLSISLTGEVKQGSQRSPDNDPTNEGLGLQVDKDFIARTKASVLKSGQKIIIDFPDTSFFNSGKIPLTKSGKKVLQQFVDAYTPYMGQYILVIQAYTDSKKVVNNKRLKYSDNLELSALRGISTLRFLQKAGLPLRNMRVAGHGELEVTRTKLENSPTNKDNPNYLLGLARRVVLVVEPLESPI